jgi:glycosyltransferase involved in cell wall biosynthesis
MKISSVEEVARVDFSESKPFQLDAAPRTQADPQPLVSVIISNYNYANYVGQAIESALNQIYRNIEVIVVDDGSTDRSSSVIDAFAPDPRLKVVYQPNAGQAAAINRGFGLSRGEIVIFLDSDDHLDPKAAETVVANWMPNLSHLQFPLELVDSGGRRIGLHPFSRHMEDGDIHWQLIVAGHFRFMPTSGNAFSRRAVSRILPIPEVEWKICADTYIAMMSPKSGPVKNLDIALGYYRIHGLNNWYTEIRSAEKLRTIWQNHVRTWRTLIRHIEVEAELNRFADRRRIRDAAALYQWRRVITGQHRHPEAFTASDRRRTKREALIELVRAKVPLRHKVLYFAFISAMAAGAYERIHLRAWINHHSARPALIRHIVNFAKGKEFYGWMRARKRISNVSLELPFDTQLRFGRGGTARAYQWYGWTRSDLYADWCIGAEAALVARAPATTETLVLELEVQPMLCDGVSTQRLEILANDVLVYRSSVSKRATLRAEIACDAWTGKSDLVLRFLTPDFLVPRFLLENVEDHRPVSFSFFWIRWSILSPEREQKRSQFPYLPTGEWVSLEDQKCLPYAEIGWQRSADGALRVCRRVAKLGATVLEPTGGDHLLSLEFQQEKELAAASLHVQVQGYHRTTIDLTRQSRLDVVLPRGSISRSGEISVTMSPSGIIGAGDRELPGEGPAGPAIRRVRLQRAVSVAKKPVFQPGMQLDFRRGGNGIQYLGPGWHKPDNIGTKSEDLLSTITGVWADPQIEVFLTFLVQPATTVGPLATPTLRIFGNGLLIARYTIDGPSELTAILPAGQIEENRLLTIELETDTLLSPYHFGDQSETRLIGIVLQAMTVN